MKWCAVMIVALGFLAQVHAQVSPSLVDFSRPTLDWYQIETENFVVLFHLDEEGRGSSRSAQVAARVAEEVYGPITKDVRV